MHLQIDTNLLTMILINLFCCCEKVSTHMKIWMMGTKNQWNIITLERIFLQPPKHKKY